MFATKNGLTLRGITSLVTRKRSKWKSDTISRNDVEVHWDRYVDKLWKFCKTKGKHVLMSGVFMLVSHKDATKII